MKLPKPKYKIGDPICFKHSNHHVMQEVKKAYLAEFGTQWEYFTDNDQCGWVKETDILAYLAERGNIQHIISLNGTTYQYSFLDSQWKEKEEKPTPLFKAEDIHTGQDYWGQEVLRGFPTKEAAEQAREALLKLSK